MEAKRIDYILSDKQLQKFCNLFGVDYVNAQALNSIACLNTDYIRDILIQHDYEEICKGIRYIKDIKVNYGFDDVMKALAREYRTTSANIKIIINGKANRNMCFCSKCGKRIRRIEYKNHNTMCTECALELLEL